MRSLNLARAVCEDADVYTGVYTFGPMLKEQQEAQVTWQKPRYDPQVTSSHCESSMLILDLAILVQHKRTVSRRKVLCRRQVRWTRGRLIRNRGNEHVSNGLQLVMERCAKTGFHGIGWSGEKMRRVP